jgi:dihydrofolate synthase/folylpolyglutamate synthase
MDSADNPGISGSLAEWLDWLLALHAQEIDLGLERISQVAHKLGVLQDTPYVISVAGTNGKGSSVAMLSAIYKAEGYRVGTYTSPHILTFNERIQIDLNPVSDKDIVSAFVAIEDARGDVKLTYFEFATLAAWIIFKKAELDVWILEVGLGGRLDAVNALDADIALVTAIDVDHSDWLGNDRNLIALEKAGIMRQGHFAVCSDNNIPQTLFDYVKEHHIELWCLNRDFDYLMKACNSASSDYGCPPTWQFLAKSEHKLASLDNLPFPALQGEFQLQNAAGVISIIQLSQSKLPVEGAAIRQGLAHVTHAGRLQSLVVGNQNWLLDVAHNPQSAKVLANFLAQSDFKGDAVFSVLKDKDYSEMIRQMIPFTNRWYIADLDVPRATSASQLKQTLTDVGVEPSLIVMTDDILSATRKAYEDNQANEGVDVLCWGSFYTVSQCLTALKAL